MDVWVIESGEYEQRGVDGVAVSVEAAVDFLKARYLYPFIVRWDDPVQTDPHIFEITGHFEAVQHYSIKHDCTFEIERYELAGGQKAAILHPL